MAQRRRDRKMTEDEKKKASFVEAGMKGELVEVCEMERDEERLDALILGARRRLGFIDGAEKEYLSLIPDDEDEDDET